MRPDPSRTALVRRARMINRELAKTYPDADIELDFATPLQLLVATILSAQSTDKRVNLVTPIVFACYPDAAALAAADRTELEELIKPTGFFRAKSDSLIKLGGALVERFDGDVPPRLGDLVTLAWRWAQDRQRGPRQRLRDPGHHGGHPCWAAVAAFRLDDAARPRESRGRYRGLVPQKRLDSAVPKHDLAWPPLLPRAQPSLWSVPSRTVVPFIR